MSTGNLSGGKTQPPHEPGNLTALAWEPHPISLGTSPHEPGNLTAICGRLEKCGFHDVLETYRPPRPVTGIDFDLLTLCWISVIRCWTCTLPYICIGITLVLACNRVRLGSEWSSAVAMKCNFRKAKSTLKDRNWLDIGNRMDFLPKIRHFRDCLGTVHRPTDSAHHRDCSGTVHGSGNSAHLEDSLGTVDSAHHRNCSRTVQRQKTANGNSPCDTAVAGDWWN
jgi:hypothetical protein